MRRASFILAGALAAIVLTTGLAAAGPGSGPRWGRSADEISPLRPGQVDGVPLSINEAERREIRRMREEEKLARDVYRTLGERWGLTPFLHIQRSEEQHLAIMGELIARTRTVDPVVNDATGVFESSEMRALYDELTRNGKTSIVAALQMGVRVEELDIADLERAIANAQNATVRETYEGLLRASRNHLRAFAANLQSRGGTYVPRHLSPDRFAAIVAGSHEPCGLCGGERSTGVGRALYCCGKGSSSDGAGGGGCGIGCGSATARPTGATGCGAGRGSRGRSGRGAASKG